MVQGWKEVYDVGQWSYRCGACGEHTTGRFGIAQFLRTSVLGSVVICSHCGCPTYFEHSTQMYPKPRYGNPVEGITEKNVQQLFSEARYCTSYGAFTAAAMLCRKILMHVSVSLGAKPDQTFKVYVDFLDREGYTPPKGKDWVDDIREMGNEANHEIRITSEQEAERTLYFTGLVLQLIYSAPHYLKKP